MPQEINSSQWLAMRRRALIRAAGGPYHIRLDKHGQFCFYHNTGLGTAIYRYPTLAEACDGVMELMQWAFTHSVYSRQ